MLKTKDSRNLKDFLSLFGLGTTPSVFQNHFRIVSILLNKSSFSLGRGAFASIISPFSFIMI